MQPAKLRKFVPFLLLPVILGALTVEPVKVYAMTWQPRMQLRIRRHVQHHRHSHHRYRYRSQHHRRHR